MKRITLLLLIITLIVDLAAPTGAVFATEGLDGSIAEEVVVDVATVGDDVVTEAGAVDACFYGYNSGYRSAAGCEFRGPSGRG